MATLIDTGVSNVNNQFRPADALAAHSTSIQAYGATHQMVNLQKYGQYGWATAPENWATNTHSVSRQVEVQVLQTPGAFKALPDSAALIATWRALWETHARKITGLTIGYDYTYEETEWGGTGQVYHDLTNIVRKQVNPRTSYRDYYGRPLFHFLNTYMQLVGMNSETKYADLVTMLDEANRPTDYLNDQKAGVVLFWEPTPDHRRVENAILVVNMMPKTTGEIELQRDLTQAGQMTDIDVDWTGTAIMSASINNLAASIMNSRNLTAASPSLRKAFMGVSADVQAASAGSVAAQIQKMSTEGAEVLAGKS